MKLTSEQRKFLKMVKTDSLLLGYLRKDKFPNFNRGFDVTELYIHDRVWSSSHISTWLNEVLNTDEYEHDDLEWINSVRILYINKDKIK